MAEEPHNNQKNVLEEAVEQFVDAQLQGREPVIDEFVKKYPDFEHQVRKRIRKLRKINNLFDSLVQPDDSDFEDEMTGQELIGKKVGSFEIDKIIGRGGMGVVYLARDTKLKRSVAIKSIPAKLTGDSNSRTRFRREAEILASLNHPNIAVIHDIIEQDESAGYLVLEYVPGETLSERIAREPLKLEEALSISRQIAKAVSTAHEKGIVHRDLKPNNIKITPDGRVKVLDFGLAKPTISEDKKSDVTATEPGRVIGTPAYMSPEQARGKPTDHRTDIWSFGCIMYQMLTGLLPFEGETATDTLAKINECQPDWEALSQQIPANIRVLLQNCLEKNPDKRLRDIKEAVIVIRETLSRTLIAPASKLRRLALIIGAVAIGIILSVFALKLIPKKEIQPSSKPIRLVILPFENLGPDDDDWFADGITDEITVRLAVIDNLSVISRQSATQYKKSNKNARQIADDLGVDYILEGTIQRALPSDPNSPVKIIPQLIKASNDMHIWADVYSGDMSEIFSLQSNVAEQVARELDITLLEPQRQALAYMATKHMKAYEYYLKGKEYYHLAYSIAEGQQSIEMYKKAIELDPDFAQAHAQLSRVYSWMYQNDKTDLHLQMAEKALKSAFQLDPDLPEAHHALGVFYYYCHRDYNLALKQYEIVRKSQPNNSEILAAIGHVQRRQGRFEKAIVNIKDAFELNPLSFSRAYSVGFTLTFMREYAEADIYFERAIKLAPAAPFPYIWKALNYVRGQGETARAREVLEGALEKVEPPEKYAIDEWLVNIDLYDRRYEEALDALDRLSSVPEDDFAHIGHIPNVLKRALIYDYWDKKELAKEHYELACNILKSKAEKQPREPVYYGTLGIAYAGLGRKDDAIRAGKRAIELDHETPNADGLIWDKNLARIYVMLGEYDKAIDKLDFLFQALPARISIPLLQTDPAWEPLHDQQWYKDLLKSDNPKK